MKLIFEDMKEPAFTIFFISVIAFAISTISLMKNLLT
jgi:hypothetical protein